MSIHVVSKVWKARLGDSTRKTVLLKLADHAKEDGSDVRPSAAHVAAQCECSDRTVRRVTAWAVKEGLLVVSQAPAGGVKTYSFDLAALDAASMAEPLTQSHPGHTVTPDTQSGPPGHTVRPPRTHSQGSGGDLGGETVLEPSENRKGTVRKRRKPLPPFGGAVLPPGFLDAAERWQTYRRESHHKAWTRKTWESQPKKFGNDPARFARAVDHSIGNGWQGLFEPLAEAGPGLARHKMTSADHFRRVMAEAEAMGQ